MAIVSDIFEQCTGAQAYNSEGNPTQEFTQWAFQHEDVILAAIRRIRFHIPDSDPSIQNRLLTMSEYERIASILRKAKARGVATDVLCRINSFVDTDMILDWLQKAGWDARLDGNRILKVTC
jgi:hypothetical protein